MIKPKNLQHRLQLIPLTLAATLLVGCGGSSSGSDDSSSLTFKEVAALGENIFEPFPQSRGDLVELTAPVTDEEDYPQEGSSATERSVCVSRRVSVLDGNGEFPLFSPNADVIYPGALLQGKTLSDATPSPIVVKRAGGTISYNINDGGYSFSVDEVKKSSVQDAMGDVIKSGSGIVPADFQIDIIQIESESQMALEMGLNVESLTTNVSADMSFTKDQTLNRTLVKLTQSYYTMSFDLPTSLDEIFDSSVTAEQLAKYVQADNPATYISSVNYGRVFYMLFESTSSRTEMEAKINVEYSAGLTSGDGQVNYGAADSLKNLKIKVIAYGGPAQGAFDLIGESDISTIAANIGSGTDILTGQPLSYVVRSVNNPDQIVGTKIATEYDEVKCEVKGVLAPAAYSKLIDLFDDGIGAAIALTDTKLVLYNTAGDKYAFFNAVGGETGPVYNYYDGPFKLDFKVGAGRRVAANELFVYDISSLQYTILKSITGSYEGDIVQATGVFPNIASNFRLTSSTTRSGPYYYSDFASDTSFYSQVPYPFPSNEITAASFVFDYAGAHGFYNFVNSGRETIYGEWRADDTGYRWGTGSDLTTKSLFGTLDSGGTVFFNGVGAATKIIYDVTSSEVLYFNMAGDQMIIERGPESNRWVEGPYVIN